MAITRRQFLKRDRPRHRRHASRPQPLRQPLRAPGAARRSTIGNRYLVVLFLDGGNDGLNTVIPSTTAAALRDAYDDARTSTDITPASADAATLDGTRHRQHRARSIGIDPDNGLRLASTTRARVGLKALYDRARSRSIQGCGYPDYSLSHEEARVIWQTGDPLGHSAYAGTGWVGRHLAGAVRRQPDPGGQHRRLGRAASSGRPAPACSRSSACDDFGFPYDDYPRTTIARQARRRSARSTQRRSPAAQPPAQYIGNSGHATLLSSESYPQAHGLYRPTGRPAIQRRTTTSAAARRATSARSRRSSTASSRALPNVNARFFQVSNGGYDTHSDQGGAETNGQHYGLHAEVGDALKVFYDDLADMRQSRTASASLVWSEFSRRIQQNDNGTDHGSQGPMFVIGGTVVGRRLRQPSRTSTMALDDEGNTVYTQDAGRRLRSTDFRDVYGTDPQALGQHDAGRHPAPNVLPVDAGDPANYWTRPTSTWASCPSGGPARRRRMTLDDYYFADPAARPRSRSSTWPDGDEPRVRRRSSPSARRLDRGARSRSSTPASRSTGRAARRWRGARAPGRRRAAGTSRSSAQPRAVRPYAQLLNTSAWLRLRRATSIPRRRTPSSSPTCSRTATAWRSTR